LVELSEGDVEVQLIALDQIDFDPDNPNTLDPSTYETLKQEIQLVGFNQPVLLWETDGRYRMIDGEHRARIVGELGASRIPAVITDAGSEDEARLRLLTMNKLRGQFIPVRLAMLLADLVQRIPEKELRRRLGMDESELRDNLRLAEFTDDVGDVLREQIAQEAQEAPVTLRFVTNARDAEVIERVVSSVADGKVDRGQALARICRNYQQKPKKGTG
jgi:ParB family chromosome partitioning protein